MPIEILMPALSPTMTEGNLVKWHKQEGDSVAAGDMIAEIETDKATMEVEAVDEGKIGKILVAEGTESVAVNAVIAILLEDGESIDDVDLNTITATKGSESTTDTPNAVASDSLVTEPVVLTETSETHQGKRIFASPLAKRIAEQKGLDLKVVQGTGPHGRIIKADVENADSQTLLSQTQFSAASYTDIKLNAMRKTIAKRLTESKQQIPHFYLSVDCFIDNVLAMRSKLNKHDGAATKFSVNDFVMKASAKALIDTPNLNVTFHGDYVRQYTQADISVAVAIDGGLVTPVVNAVNRKNLTDISLEVKDLASQARAGTLNPSAYSGGSFTISNLGMYGVNQFNAIINPPQAAILAVGAGQKKAVVNEMGEIIVATVMSCALSVDHRAADGADAAKFLRHFKEYMENPVLMLS